MLVAAEALVRKPAPNFTLLDFVSGEEVSLNSLKGRKILLTFYRCVCSPA
jgi:peroxiredoxin